MGETGNAQRVLIENLIATNLQADQDQLHVLAVFYCLYLLGEPQSHSGYSCGYEKNCKVCARN
jgi:hypothetical protein